MNALIIFFVILLWGISSFAGKVASQHAKPMQVYVYEALGSILIASLCFLLLSYIPRIRKLILPDASLINTESQVIWWGLIMGIGYGFGTFLFIVALKRSENTSIITTFGALYPFVTLILAIIFLKEKMSAMKVAAIATALISIFLAWLA